MESKMQVVNTKGKLRPPLPASKPPPVPPKFRKAPLFKAYPRSAAGRIQESTRVPAALSTMIEDYAYSPDEKFFMNLQNYPNVLKELTSEYVYHPAVQLNGNFVYATSEDHTKKIYPGNVIEDYPYDSVIVYYHVSETETEGKRKGFIFNHATDRVVDQDEEYIDGRLTMVNVIDYLIGFPIDLDTRYTRENPGFSETIIFHNNPGGVVVQSNIARDDGLIFGNTPVDYVVRENYDGSLTVDINGEVA